MSHFCGDPHCCRCSLFYSTPNHILHFKLKHGTHLERNLHFSLSAGPVCSDCFRWVYLNYNRSYIVASLLCNCVYRQGVMHIIISGPHLHQPSISNNFVRSHHVKPSLGKVMNKMMLLLHLQNVKAFGFLLEKRGWKSFCYQIMIDWFEKTFSDFSEVLGINFYWVDCCMIALLCVLSVVLSFNFICVDFAFIYSGTVNASHSCLQSIEFH